MSDYKICANHAHLFPKNTKPNGDIDNLKALMDACEIEKAVCFAHPLLKIFLIIYMGFHKNGKNVHNYSV